MDKGEAGLGIQPLDTSDLSAPASRTDWVGRGEGAKQSPEAAHETTWKVIQVRLQRKEEALSVSASQTTPPPSVLKVLATTLTPGPLFQLRPEEPHSDPLPGSIAPMSHNPV